MAEFKTPIKSNKGTTESKEFVIPPSPFLNRLGYGTGVSVLQLVRSPKAGELRSPWALKMINKRVKKNKVYSDRLRAEAEILQQISHPNIVGFRAFNKTKDLCLGMEQCDVSLGDLIEKKIEDGDTSPFVPKNILKVALDMGHALDHLHTKVKLLHGDIKSYNVLINGPFDICKLCDFGVTLPLDENGVFDQENAGHALYYGTEAWSAPEVLAGESITNKTDIFSLGLTLWEMLALTPPHSLQDQSIASDCSDDYQDLMFEKYGTRPAVPDHVCPTAYSCPLTLFVACTEPDPRRRPPADQLVVAAADMMEQSPTTSLHST